LALIRVRVLAPSPRCRLRTAAPLLTFSSYRCRGPGTLHSFPTRRSSDLHGGYALQAHLNMEVTNRLIQRDKKLIIFFAHHHVARSEEHTSELQSRFDLVCRLLLEKKKSQFRRIHSA